MKKYVLTAAAIALGLNGCATCRMDFKAPDAHNPRVSVVSGRYLVVDQEPIVVPKGVKDFRITWQLATGSSYTFPADGIVISEGGDEFQCKLEDGRQAFSCIFRNSRPGRYKYTIKAMDGDKALAALDPIIMNDI